MLMSLIRWRLLKSIGIDLYYWAVFDVELFGVLKGWDVFDYWLGVFDVEVHLLSSKVKPCLHFTHSNPSL